MSSVQNPQGTFLGPHVPTIYNVTAWPAQGQVWITWKITLPSGVSASGSNDIEAIGYAIYRGEACPNCPLGNYTWHLEGRLFDEDARGQRLRDLETITTSNETLTIPNGNGGDHVLTADERVFASSPHQTRTDVVYSVQPIFLHKNDVPTCSSYTSYPANPADTEVSDPITYNHDPINNPVKPVEQKRSVLNVQFADDNGNMIDGSFPYAIFCLWVDGSSQPDDHRDDIEVMGSASRNGVPHLFVVYGPDPALPIPNRANISPYYALSGNDAQLDEASMGLVHVLHGGGGNVFKFSPGNMPSMDLIPYTCYLVAHDDDLYAISGGCSVVNRASAWFGYASQYDAFKHPSNNNSLAEGDVVYNFTQRRVMWINNWLLNQQALGIAPDNVSMIGFSMGSHGASHIARAFPNEFASVVMNAHSAVVINPSDYQNAALGADNPDQTFCNLNNAAGQPANMREVWVYNNRLSSERDYPLMKQLQGKLDDNDLQQWRPESVLQARIAIEDQGWGLQFFFDQRGHGGQDPNTFWAESPYGFINRSAQFAANWQTRYRKSRSYPAFYRVRLGDVPTVATTDSIIPDPGDGSNPITGTGSGVATGDPHGTIGGHIGWYRLIDEPAIWSVDAFLIGAQNPPPAFSPYAPKDRSIKAFGAAFMTVRKNVFFLPDKGMQVNLNITQVTGNATNPAGTVLYSGQVTTSPDDALIRIDHVDIKLFDDAVVRITLT